MIRRKWRVVRWEWMRFKWWVVDEWWTFLTGLLWMVGDYREAYYAYREKRWRGASDAMSFKKWLRNGGWRFDCDE